MRYFILLSFLLLVSFNSYSLNQYNDARNKFGIQLNYVNDSLFKNMQLPNKTQQLGVQFQFFHKKIFNDSVNFFLQSGFEQLNTQTKKENYKQKLFNIAIGPMFEINLFKINQFDTFFLIGVQPGYISQKTFGNRDLGMRFTFRDTIGLGTYINDDWKVSLSFIHYSHLCGCINQGINAPVELGVTYSF